MKTKPFDLKECMEKHGGRCVSEATFLPVRIIVTDRKVEGKIDNGFNIVGLVERNGTEIVSIYSEKGYNQAIGEDLVLPVKTKTVWIAVWVTSEGFLNTFYQPNRWLISFSTKEDAQKHFSNIDNSELLLNLQFLPVEIEE